VWSSVFLGKDKEKTQVLLPLVVALIPFWRIATSIPVPGQSSSRIGKRKSPCMVIQAAALSQYTRGLWAALG